MCSIYQEYKALCRNETIFSSIYNKQEVARSVIQLHLKATKIACEHILKENYRGFDATVGDHNCHLITHFALDCFQSSAFSEEVRTTLEKVNELLKQISDHKKDYRLLDNFSPPISEKLKTLMSLALLKEATVCEEFRDRPMVLRLDSSRVQQKLSKNCSIDIIKQLLTAFRESVNKDLIAYAKQLPTAKHLDIEVKQKTPHAHFTYICATSSLKATLEDLHRKGTSFSIEQYTKPGEKHKQPFVVFTPKGDFPYLAQHDPKFISPKMPVMGIQMFYDIPTEEAGKFLESYGLINFMLQSVAKNSQFNDLKTESYSHDEDLEKLPFEVKEEICSLRKAELPKSYTIVHTYPTTMEDLCSRFQSTL